MAIRAVFDQAFQFKLNFTHERGRFVCQPVIVEGENEYEPKDEMGGSIIDIISFTFRVVLWHLSHPRSQNVFVLDEPMRFVGMGDELMKAARILKEISAKLGFQLIIVTHIQELASIADRAWQVTRRGKKSEVKQIVFDKPEPKKVLVRRKK